MPFPKKLSGDEMMLIGAIIKVKEGLKSGFIERKDFNMRHFKYCPVATGCGTAHCIGGWASYFLGLPDDESPLRKLKNIRASLRSNIENLFYPEMAGSIGQNSIYWDATPEQAIKAINRLLLGRNPWDFKRKVKK